MRKFFSVVAALIIFVSMSIAHAEPRIQAEITNFTFELPEDSIVLSVTLYNTGDQNAELTSLEIHELNIHDTDGNLLWTGSVNFNNLSNCYIEAGHHISDVPFTITNANVPRYDGRVHCDWKYTTNCRSC